MMGILIKTKHRVHSQLLTGHCKFIYLFIYLSPSLTVPASALVFDMRYCQGVDCMVKFHIKVHGKDQSVDYFTIFDHSVYL